MVPAVRPIACKIEQGNADKKEVGFGNGLNHRSQQQPRNPSKTQEPNEDGGDETYRLQHRGYKCVANVQPEVWPSKRLMRMPWKQSLKGDNEDEEHHDGTEPILGLIQPKASKKQGKNSQDDGAGPPTNWWKTWRRWDHHLGFEGGRRNITFHGI